MKQNLLTLILLLVIVVRANAQTAELKTSRILADEIEDYRFTTEDWAERFNKDFAKLLGATGDGVSIGSFASLDLVNPKFVFNGAIPISPIKKNKKSISILSIEAQGSLEADNIAYIFSNRKKTSAASLAINYHFGLKFSRPELSAENINLLLLNEYSVNRKKMLSRTQLTAKRDFLGALIVKYNADSNNLAIRKKQLYSKISQARLQIDKYSNDYNALPNCLPDSATDLEKASLKLEKDTLSSFINYTTKILSSELDSLFMVDSQINKNGYLKDSLIAEDRYINVDGERENLINKDTRESLFKLKENLLFYKYQLRWWTFNLSYTRNQIYLYDPTAFYHQRINPKVFNLFSGGLAYNIYDKNQFANLSYLVKIGANFSRTTNIDFFESTPITQEFVDKDSLGTTTRKTASSYNVYTDHISTTQNLKLYSDLYLVMNTSPVGIHLFPEYIFTKYGGWILNSGIGFISSFRNRKKDSPVINMEVYTKFYEIGTPKSKKELNDHFLFGIKFSLPFNFF